jgi:hypothetical protein
MSIVKDGPETPIRVQVGSETVTMTPGEGFGLDRNALPGKSATEQSQVACTARIAKSRAMTGSSALGKI